MTEHLRAAIAAALESLDAGDQREACSILLAALDGGPRKARATCEVCAVPFEWPGQLDAHQRLHREVNSA